MHFYDRPDSSESAAFQSAVADISKDTLNVMVTDPAIVIPIPVESNVRLTYLIGKRTGFLPSELNRGEREIRRHHA